MAKPQKTAAQPAEASKPAKPAKPMHTGHRQRMRSRVKQNGFASLADHEVLEYLLFFVLPRQDTNPIAHRLLEQFHSVENVLAAPVEELCRVDGIGPTAAEFLHALHETNRYCEMSRARTPKRFTETAQIAEYLVSWFRGKKQEVLLMLALDDRGTLVRTICLQEGTVGSVAINVNQMAAQALNTGAPVMVFAHNHPGGVAAPSRDDMITTANLMQALAVLQIRVSDHIIVAGEDWISLRETGRMPRFNARTGLFDYF